MKKRTFFTLAALVAALEVSAQEPKRLDLSHPDTMRNRGFRLPDSLAHLAPWQTAGPQFQFPTTTEAKTAIPMSSVLLVRRRNFPSRVIVLNNNTLRLGTHFNVSNGQAWNWGPFPNRFLDARTLSLPLPR